MSRTSLMDEWEASVQEAFPTAVPNTAVFTGAANIANLLTALSRRGCVHFFLPDRGGHDISGARVSPFDDDAIEWHTSHDSDDGFKLAVNVMRPTIASFRCPPGRLDLAHVILECGTMEAQRPANVHGGREELAQLPSGTYDSRQNFQADSMQGRGESFPLGTRYVTRYVQPARFALFAKASSYNKMPDPDAYDAIHTDSAKFDAVLQALLRLPPDHFA
ncbi:hypothetical protein [Pigmentiphaga daeguensis]|uniref:Uncharacterized protein n=1 Tax=Pigmentiphaga daeguensis TaxID=414049 RepID=A0ABP3LUI3_9BURK